MPTNFNKALFRIDPTEGLIKYAAAIKPYHTKVLDVFVEYLYTESMHVTARDKNYTTVTLTSGVDEPPIVHTCGYGFVWSPYDSSNIPTLPSATVIKALGSSSIKVQPVINTSTLAVQPGQLEEVPQLADRVTVFTSGSFPQTIPPIMQGMDYYVVSSTPTAIELSDVVNGSPLVFNTMGTGLLEIRDANTPTNAFLVSPSAQPAISCVVSNTIKGELTLTIVHSVVGVQPVANTWIIQGDVTSQTELNGTIWITNNVPGANVKYTVASVVYNPGANQTTIQTVQPIPTTSSSIGDIHIPLLPDNVPYWPVGSAIKVSSTGDIPSGLPTTTSYYYIPGSVFGTFRLSSVRYPQSVTDMLTLLSNGTGRLLVKRTEPFVPGDQAILTGSFNGINDQVYSILSSSPTGDNFTIRVVEYIEQITQSTSTSDGILTYSNGFGDPFCIPASAPQLHTATFFDERLRFDFGPIPVLRYLLDTFAGTGNLSTHSVDSGHLWSIFQTTDNLSELILTGQGSTSTADSDIWVRANWSVPANFHIESDVYIGKHTTNSPPPYVRIFSKETNTATFYGPYVDVFCNSATNKIDLFIGDGDGAIGNTATITTGLDCDQYVTVRLNIQASGMWSVFANGTQLYASSQVTWPSLRYVGFNFANPGGDVAKLAISRYFADATGPVIPQFMSSVSNSCGLVDGTGQFRIVFSVSEFDPTGTYELLDHNNNLLIPTTANTPTTYNHVAGDSTVGWGSPSTFFTSLAGIESTLIGQSLKVRYTGSTGSQIISTAVIPNCVVNAGLIGGFTITPNNVLEGTEVTFTNTGSSTGDFYEYLLNGTNLIGNTADFVFDTSGLSLGTSYSVVQNITKLSPTLQTVSTTNTLVIL